MDISAMLTSAVDDDPDRVGIEFEGVPISCRTLHEYFGQLQGTLVQAGVPANAPIALLARNRPAQAAALLGLVESRRAVSNVYAFQSPEAVAADLESSRFQVIVAEASDWTGPVIEAARRLGAVGISLSFADQPKVQLVPGLERPGPGPFRPPLDEPGLEILSSGTTGPPKRVAISNRVLMRTVQSLLQGGGSAGKLAPDIVIWPIAGVGGASCVIGDFALKRTIVLLERFDLPVWLEAVRRHRVPTTNVPPTVLRMILDADTPRESLTDLKYIFGGAAPLSPELQDEFEAAYGIPLIWAYGATEFCGTLTSWTPELYETYRNSKRGSIGRPVGGTEIRIVDQGTGLQLPVGQIGLVEAHAIEMGPDWVRTTDLAYFDEDGFLFHQGRADGAIVRGGFKILPERIDDVLREHDSVFDAATVGLGDARLGQIPVTAVELAHGKPAPTPDDLIAFLKQRVSAPYIPSRIRIVDRLPRTTSLKPKIDELRELFEQEADDATG